MPDGIPDDLSGLEDELDGELVIDIEGDSEILGAAVRATRIGERLALLAEGVRPMDHEGTVTRLELRGSSYAVLMIVDAQTGEWHLGIARSPWKEE